MADTKPAAQPRVFLPPLRHVRSPNQSARLHGLIPYLIVIHRPVGGYQGSIRTLCDNTKPADQRVSAHLITDSNREATQLVPWDRKAWTCGAFNSASYNLEIDDDAWNGKDPAAFNTAARITAYLCKRTGIPPRWSTDPTTKPGVVRHADLGRAGGGHSDPTTDLKVWRRFIDRVDFEHDRGGFRPTYGTGQLRRIDV